MKPDNMTDESITAVALGKTVTYTAKLHTTDGREGGDSCASQLSFKESASLC